jgi:transmembrane sensor
MSKESTDQTEQTAAEWLIRRQSGRWTDTEQAELDRWLGASTLHLVAYLRLELGWEDAARLKALAPPGGVDFPPSASQLNLSPFFDTQSPALRGDSESIGARTPVAIAPVAIDGVAVQAPSGRRKTSLLSAVAGIVLAVSAGIYLYVSGAFTGDRYSTPVGRIVSVPMADGSKVTLNTNSRIRVTLADQERRVVLDEGEAFFQVAKDPARPFVVTVGNKRVIAVGTEFSVRRDASDIQVVVTEGKVRIEDSSLIQSSSAPGRAADIFLTPGSIARASDTGVMVQRKTLLEVEEHLSWRSGVLMFRQSTLADAAAEFNRYNVQQIVIDDASIASLPIEGNFRATNAADFAHLLENGYPVVAKEEADRIVLKARASGRASR